ncbi:myosin-IB [Sipha flava]|uniref:Myosin-IB n=1 Tax=Sipha flava TaxID=143950 RepID=A0A2S2R1H7_9HEMI|nr:myosin-IB [Sipha flava]
MFDETTGVTNMVLLDDCDEEKLIENLKKRLEKNIIYTYIGEVLISVNPYKPLSEYYDKFMFKNYNKSHAEENPHIFAISAKVFASLKEYRQDQCILISGESGSGKTEASKKVLEYIAKATSSDDIVQIIKDKLLVANSVLEAFGNAKTRNNDNSSRFGKYMDVQFDHMDQPIGGNILNYLLEKSRVIKQAHNERNYHIFYQLVNGADKWLAELLEIDKDIGYEYLRTDKNDSCDSFEDHQTFDEDSKKYKETLQAFKTLEFDLEETMDVLKIIASILHLGNVKVRAHDEICKIENIGTVFLVADLLGVPKDDLIFALTNKTIKAHDEVIQSSLDVETSNFAKDALAKAIYSRLFEWLVAHINRTLKTTVSKNGGRFNKNKSIGILDIYGFEILHNNGFEQFCINYCNEKLQKLFLDLTIKSEQQEYLNEGIEWTHIEYFDNTFICDMIEERHKGIISCLEDESLKHTDTGNNMILLNELARRFKHHKHFSCFQSTDCQIKKTIISPAEFLIVHFAGAVKYDASSFLEKNNDSLFGNLSQIMSNSTNIIIKSCFSDCLTPNKKIPETTIKQFKNSLNQLIITLKSKQPSYIRCIKPNHHKIPGNFDVEVVRNQVKYMGLVEILHIRKAGFTYRGKLEEFLDRYKSLCPDTWPNWKGRFTTAGDAVARLIDHLEYTVEDCKIGKTKVLIKHPRTVFDIENRFRASKHLLAATIQATWRGHVARVKYTQLKTTTIRCQWLIRRHLRRERLRRIKEHEIVVQKIVFIQKNVRRMLAMSAYKKKWNAALTIRNFIKGFMTINDPPNAYNCRFKTYRYKKYLIDLSETLPKSLIDYRWPEPPTCCVEISQYLMTLHRAWLSRIYRLDLAKRPGLYERLQFKLAASEIFKGKKSMYPESLKINFDNDRCGILRQLINVFPEDSNFNTTYMYATKVTKFNRRGYKRRERILAITANAIIFVEKTDKNQKIKDHLPLKYVTSLQMTSGTDNFLLIKVSGELEKSKGDVLLEVPHLVECVTIISAQSFTGTIDFIDMQTNSSMKHNIKNLKNPGYIEFIPVNVTERKGEIRKGSSGNLTITG